MSDTPSFQQRDAVTGPTLAPPWLCAYGSNAQKFLYLIGLALDMLLEKQNEAMLAKCPGRADDSALPYQAADRLLEQGPAETNAQFTLRLQGAFDAWARAGSRASVLAQIQAYLTNQTPGVAMVPGSTGLPPTHAIVGGNTTYTTWDLITGDMEQGAPPAHSLVTPPNWDWDGRDQPWRAWLILYMYPANLQHSGGAGSIASTGGSGVAGVTRGFATLTGLTSPDGDFTSADVGRWLLVSGAASSGNNGFFPITSVLSSTSVIIANPNAVAPDANNGAIGFNTYEYPYIGPGPVWGAPSFVWGDFTWGLSCSPLILESLRRILKRWKSAATYYPKIIIAFPTGTDAAELSTGLDPSSAQGAGNPDGTWVDWGRNVNGVWVPAKQPNSPFTAFCDGSGLAVNCYEKNVG